VVEAHICTTHDRHKKQISMPSLGFYPAIPAIKWPQIRALDRTAIGIEFKEV